MKASVGHRHDLHEGFSISFYLKLHWSVTHDSARCAVSQSYELPWSSKHWFRFMAKGICHGGEEWRNHWDMDTYRVRTELHIGCTANVLMYLGMLLSIWGTSCIICSVCAVLIVSCSAGYNTWICVCGPKSYPVLQDTMRGFWTRLVLNRKNKLKLILTFWIII